MRSNSAGLYFAGPGDIAHFYMLISLSSKAMQNILKKCNKKVSETEQEEHLLRKGYKRGEV